MKKPPDLIKDIREKLVELNNKKTFSLVKKLRKKIEDKYEP